MTGDTADNVAVALSGGLILTPAAFAHLHRHPACSGQVLTAVPLRGFRRPADVSLSASAGAFSANN